MNNKIIVGIDVDDVVADLLPVWISKYNIDYGDSLHPSRITDWDMVQFVKPQCGKHIYDYLEDPTLYEDIEPIENSLWGVNVLRELGFRLAFITASTSGHSGIKRKWLKNYMFLESNSEYYEAYDKSLIASDYLIDDRDLNVINAYGQGIIFDHPHNQTLQGYPRVYNWEDIVKYFETVAKQNEIIGV